jgi:hypothetical protein
MKQIRRDADGSVAQLKAASGNSSKLHHAESEAFCVDEIG